MIVIDVPSHFRAIKNYAPGGKINYELYLRDLMEKREAPGLIKTYFYLTQINDEGVNFARFLRSIGGIVRINTADIILDGQPNLSATDRNFAIALDVATQIINGQVSEVIFGTSNFKIIPLIEFVKARGIPTALYTPFPDRELALSCDYNIVIDKRIIGYENANESQ